ncbi:MAG TPA: hypothetical protein VHT34_05405, partial [Clostridia bacterium]|nr:hypothetical protein [Clostridia bacterium]
SEFLVFFKDLIPIITPDLRSVSFFKRRIILLFIKVKVPGSRRMPNFLKMLRNWETNIGPISVIR